MVLVSTLVHVFMVKESDDACFLTSDLDLGLSSLRLQNSFNTLFQMFKRCFNVSIAMDAAPSKRLNFNFTTLSILCLDNLNLSAAYTTIFILQKAQQTN